MQETLELEKGGYDVKHYPEPISLPEYLSTMLGVQAKPINVKKQLIEGMVKDVMGEQAWRPISQTLDGVMMLKTEPTLTVLPTAIVVK